jgi:spore coat protein JB
MVTANATAKQLKLMEQLQAIDFAITEMSLYLDTHPTDENALAQYNELTERRKEVKAAVEVEFGSLTKTEPYVKGKTAGWDEGPWPWQL